MLSFPKVKTLLTYWDVFAAILAPVLALLIRSGTMDPNKLNRSFVFYAFFSTIATLTLSRMSGVSNVAWRFFSFPDAVDAFSSIGLGIIVAIAAGFASNTLESLPRSVPVLHLWLQFSAYAGARLLFKRAANYSKQTKTRPTNVLLIGCNQTSYLYARAVESIGQRSIRIVGALSHDPSMIGQKLRGIRIMATFERIEQAIAKLGLHGVKINRLVLAANEAEITSASLDLITDAAKRSNIQLVDIHSLFTEVAGALDEEDEFGIHIIELRGTYWIAKRALDVLAATALLIVLSPLIAVTFLLVAFDIGFPVIFWQQRLGQHGRPIHVYKFRTMVDDLRGSLPLPDEERTSRLGSFLRACRLDELPQLWNILRGDMSFIGPRPLLPVDQPAEIAQRLAIRPGVSGWAQVNGGRLITPEEKRALDLWYIAHVSFWLDLLTAWKTFEVVIQGDRRKDQEINRALLWLKERETEIVFADA